MIRMLRIPVFSAVKSESVVDSAWVTHCRQVPNRGRVLPPRRSSIKFRCMTQVCGEWQQTHTALKGVSSHLRSNHICRRSSNHSWPGLGKSRMPARLIPAGLLTAENATLFATARLSTEPPTFPSASARVSLSTLGIFRQNSSFPRIVNQLWNHLFLHICWLLNFNNRNQLCLPQAENHPRKHIEIAEKPDSPLINSKKGLIRILENRE